jgi:hypothetical protein
VAHARPKKSMAKGIEKHLAHKRFCWPSPEKSEAYHGFLRVNIPVCESYICSHSTYKTLPVKGELGQ